MMVSKMARLACACAVLTIGGGVLAQQTVPDASVPGSAGLDLPANLQIFGKADPNVRKPTAIVNDSVITGTDVDQRMSMTLALNNMPGIPDDQRDEVRLQVLRQLIDETLQIQEAKANEIAVTQGEVDQSFDRVSRNFKRTPEQMREYLRSVGSSDRSLKRQIEGELAWNRLLRRKVTPFVNVSDEEVKSIIDRLKASQGAEEYHLREIYLSAPEERQAEVIENARKMIEQMRGGAPFEYFARNFSEASTKAVGGDLDWVRLGVLPPELQQAAQQMQVGQIAGPIPIPGGFSILYLADKRQVLTADPRDARLSLRQLTLKFPGGTTQNQASARAADFAKATQRINGCGGVAAIAQEIGAEVVDNDAVPVRQLPPALQEIVLKMQVGQSTPPFGSPSDGVRALVLCGRDDPKTAGLPSSEAIQSKLEDERVNLRAQRMLRDLRRDAVVEYR
ncbi:periplasmic chaperone for outer membrane proteins SurA [Sphingomonas guangdongensis]|uniref:Parvulin-like PPIase n=1 Tax=Sphingomonas guangdongensis TaxID=1141890 RepID=A0A285R5B1_9SPHN|nr:peptidylprolyl isomerase [Sphingomonas guangdongensis]SOB87542.1 periplasmic chaperone for outer membrane proteins SurA [Sphingomonas guangdongensis]